LKSVFQNFFWISENGQKKCPKLKTQNTFWKNYVGIFYYFHVGNQKMPYFIAYSNVIYINKKVTRLFPKWKFQKIPENSRKFQKIPEK
jgi:hypothetical protein